MLMENIFTSFLMMNVFRVYVCERVRVRVCVSAENFTTSKLVSSTQNVILLELHVCYSIPEGTFSFVSEYFVFK